MRGLLKSQLVRLLTLASAVDPIRIDEVAVDAWLDVVGHVDYEVAHEALREHRKTSTEPFKPAHVIAFAKGKVQRWDNGIARPPAPPGKKYAMDIIDEVDIADAIGMVKRGELE